MSARKKFKALMAAPGYVVAPGAYDTLTARMVQNAGFDAVYMTGGGYSRANGYPDIGLLTMTEVVQWLSRTVDVVDIPVIADMDAGYGNAVNVVRSVREANDRGYDCLVLEDCVASYFPEFQVMALRMIKAQGGIFGWVGDSKRFLAALGKAKGRKK